jgi:hypothetical protein
MMPTKARRSRSGMVGGRCGRILFPAAVVAAARSSKECITKTECDCTVFLASTTCPDGNNSCALYCGCDDSGIRVAVSPEFVKSIPTGSGGWKQHDCRPEARFALRRSAQCRSWDPLAPLVPALLCGYMHVSFR